MQLKNKMDKVDEFIKKVGDERALGDLTAAETAELSDLLIKTGDIGAIYLGALMKSKLWQQNSAPKE